MILITFKTSVSGKVEDEMDSRAFPPPSRRLDSIWRERKFPVGLCLAVWCLTGGSHAAFSQSGQPAGGTQGSLPVFEAASVKSVPAQPGFRQPGVMKCENGRLTMHNASFMGIVSWAFDMRSWNIVVPSWAAETPEQPLYDIDAEADGPVPQAQVKLMLQRLLAERFQFAAHHEMREGVQRVLRVAKGGPKLKEAGAVEPGTPVGPATPRVRNDQANSRIICKGATLEEFLLRLNVTGIGGPIYDQTGLTGRYDFTLDYGKYIEDSDPAHRLNALQQARFDAMHELGLEVAEVKMPVDTLVVDRAEKRPTGN
jgi:uncharacterized protein (TIGR03435 family)